ncbi:hypothetical protein GCM10027033_20260 [Leucobacter ruminantium]
MPKTETFAANHGQKRSRGRAVRSDSGTISIPVRSTSGEAGRSGPACGRSDMAWLPGTRVDGGCAPILAGAVPASGSIPRLDP